MSVTRLWTRVRDLGVARAFLVAVASALVLWLLIIALGPGAIFVMMPSGLVYLAFFGSAFLSAVSRWRFLPRAAAIEFTVPIFCGLGLVLGAGLLGIRVARFLNDSLFHMSDSFVR